ncbi:hypothetical protein [Butyrivibrio sp. YAB3001]|uniref:hypothetical protein n=1 Tax=Butyrivibrio sp. YAB3001 TaxID=1520812 RepID=UPI0008F61ADF|nr:hypothetical protein [Butyrivibrio sp. YAB3001]SFC27516.1 hypothetical protein SAMN02910398_01873 [Butyrivibrio sp. YAB3001]
MEKDVASFIDLFKHLDKESEQGTLKKSDVQQAFNKFRLLTNDSTLQKYFSDQEVKSIGARLSTMLSKFS